MAIISSKNLFAQLSTIFAIVKIIREDKDEIRWILILSVPRYFVRDDVVGGVKSFLQPVAMHRETRQLMGQSATFPIGLWLALRQVTPVSNSIWTSSTSNLMLVVYTRFCMRQRWSLAALLCRWMIHFSRSRVKTICDAHILVYLRLSSSSKYD